MSQIMSFEDITRDILANKRFIKIGNESHHGITRLEHSMRVAYYTYRASLRFNLDYVSATRAAMLHDFFVDEEFGNTKGLAKGIVHPNIALANASAEFSLNEIEKNAIVAHMFPLNMTLPRYKESLVLTVVDKMVAIYEYTTAKFNYHKLTSKMSTAMALLVLFTFNILTAGHK